ncbi:hypothetical protein C7212DRAFT_360616 [Tuber magnatum]|uniref:Cora-domain-containing protein n=1 Tax=Tuber magnatum TaxID=42249 RepID=A0A317SX83_9PEZI|nr:hypothetical protein C7212DRAFT_360616 [Tuber magnatum]
MPGPVTNPVGLPGPTPKPSTGWETIAQQPHFYDDQDCLHPGHKLTGEKLNNRKADDVVIFDYSLCPDYLSEGGPSSGDPNPDNDALFKVSKDKLMESDQFDQIINPAKKSLRRLGIITGISFRVPFEKPSDLEKPRSSEDGFTLFVSFPYLGSSGIGFRSGFRSESVRLLDFKGLGVTVPDRGDPESEEENDDIGEILVHQARYMIFDNYTMATFRSKEDKNKDQVPLHHFQERICAFRAMIHMIANRMDLELWTMEKLEASLWILDRIISEPNSHGSDQEMNEIPNTLPELPPGITLPPREQSRTKDHDRVQQKNATKEERGVRDLIFFNRLLAGLFAAISVAERQIAILQDLHSVFWTSYRTGNKVHEKRYPLRQNAFYKNIALIPAPPENTGEMWPDTLDIIDEVIRERKSVIKRVKGLVENMDIRRKMLIDKSTKDTLEQQAQTLSGFTVVTTAFLPLSFCTSYFGMNNIKEFNASPISRRDFWLVTGPRGDSPLMSQ